MGSEKTVPANCGLEDPEEIDITTGLPNRSCQRNRIGNSKHRRYQALLEIGVDPCEARELSKTCTFQDLASMGFVFPNRNPPQKRPHPEDTSQGHRDKAKQSKLAELEPPSLLGKGVKMRYQALIKIGVPPSDAESLAEYTFAELKNMGYKFPNLPPEPVSQSSTRTIPAPRSNKGNSSSITAGFKLRYKALRIIGVPSSEAEHLAEKPFAELKDMGYKFPDLSLVEPNEPGNAETSPKKKTGKAREMEPELRVARFAREKPSSSRTHRESPIRTREMEPDLRETRLTRDSPTRSRTHRKSPYTSRETQPDLRETRLSRDNPASSRTRNLKSPYEGREMQSHRRESRFTRESRDSPNRGRTHRRSPYEPREMERDLRETRLTRGSPPRRPRHLESPYNSREMEPDLRETRLAQDNPSGRRTQRQSPYKSRDREPDLRETRLARDNPGSSRTNRMSPYKPREMEPDLRDTRLARDNPANTRGHRKSPNYTARQEEADMKISGFPQYNPSSTEPQDPSPTSSPTNSATLAYKEVPKSIQVGILNEEPMTDVQMELLQDSILSIIAGLGMGEGPVFQECTSRPGWLLITCENKFSKTWLMNKVPTLKPWLGAKLKVVDENNLPRSYLASLFIPDSGDTGVQVALDLIRAQNKGLNTNLWNILDTVVEKNGVTLIISPDDASVDVIKRLENKANLGFKKVQFEVKEAIHPVQQAETGTKTQLSSNNSFAQAYQSTSQASTNPNVQMTIPPLMMYPSGYENFWGAAHLWGMETPGQQGFGAMPNFY